MTAVDSCLATPLVVWADAGVVLISLGKQTPLSA